MKRWLVKNKDKILADDLSNRLNVSPEIMEILRNRNIDTFEEAEIFINPSLSFLRNPFLMKGMKEAAARILKAIENRENIFIYGDYDVDGVSSTSILLIFFKSIGVKAKYYIPNRLEEGYGLNKDAIRILKARGADLIITVDCGITSVEEVELAGKLGMDVIITDHHECQSELPDAVAVIDPKQEGCGYPFKMLCGCGIAFKLIQALTDERAFETEAANYLEIVAMATICDMVPLVDENRIIVKNGLDIIEKGINPGVKALFEVCNIRDARVRSSHIGYEVGPRINAAGRLGFSDLGVNLLTSETYEEAVMYARELDDKNNIRKELVESIYAEADSIIENDAGYRDEKVLVVAGKNWQSGVIGIVSSRITEKYYKPSIVMNIDDDGFATGSARSIKGFNLFEAMCSCSSLMEKFGGHEQAAGLTIKAENIDALRKQINEVADYELEKEDMIEDVDIEFKLSENSADLDFFDELHILEPYGIGNPLPLFMFSDMKIENLRLIGVNRNHVKFDLKGLLNHECIGFNMDYITENLKVGDYVDLVFSLDKNTFRGKTKSQLILKDMKKRQPGNYIYDKESVSLDYMSVKGMYSVCQKMVEQNYSPDNFIFSRKSVLGFDFRNIKGDDIGKACRDRKTVVFVKTKQNYFKVISHLNASGISIVRTPFDRFDFNHKVNNEFVDVVFANDIDTIDFNIYNNIIIVDALNNNEIASLEDLFHENSIFIVEDEKSITYLNKNLSDMCPSREECMEVYRYFISRKSAEIAGDRICSLFATSPDMSPIKIFSILSIFREADLLDFDYDIYSSVLKVAALPIPKEKKNLENTIFKAGIKMLTGR